MKKIVLTILNEKAVIESKCYECTYINPEATRTYKCAAIGKCPGRPPKEKELAPALMGLSDAYLDLASRWMDTTNGKFNDSKGIVKIAIAEYMANQSGYTLY